MVTIYDIAKKAKVSPSTVSKVINNYDTIPEKTKAKVLKVMRELDYVPDASAKALSKGRSYDVGVLAYFGIDVTPFKHALFIAILDAFQREMVIHNYDLVFIARNVAGHKGSFYKNCKSRGVAGVLLIGDLNSEEMQEVIASDIPKIAFDYNGSLITSVSSDNYEKMKELTNLVLDKGHRNIVFVHGEPNHATLRRIEGFKDALKERGLEVNDKMLLQTKYLDIESVKDITTDLMHRVNPPSLIMYPDDTTALAGLLRLREMGLNCPNDISITGFDGLDMSQMGSVHLTTCKQDTDKIGRLLASNLIKIIEEKGKTPIEHFYVEAEILTGQSVKDLNK